jgi:hypothetical protein
MLIRRLTDSKPSTAVLNDWAQAPKLDRHFRVAASAGPPFSLGASKIDKDIEKKTTVFGIQSSHKILQARILLDLRTKAASGKGLLEPQGKQESTHGASF